MGLLDGFTRDIFDMGTSFTIHAGYPTWGRLRTTTKLGDYIKDLLSEKFKEDSIIFNPPKFNGPNYTSKTPEYHLWSVDIECSLDDPRILDCCLSSEKISNLVGGRWVFFKFKKCGVTRHMFCGWDNNDNYGLYLDNYGLYLEQPHAD